MLRKGIAKQMSKTSAPAPPVTPTKPVKASGANAKTKRVPKRADESKAGPAALPVSTDRDWTDQQRNRWSTRTRAVMHGLIVAVMLFVGAAVFTRLWGALAPLILQ